MVISAAERFLFVFLGQVDLRPLVRAQLLSTRVSCDGVGGALHGAAAGGVLRALARCQLPVARCTHSEWIRRIHTTPNAST